MKVVYITNITPTPDNYNASSAHPYHLLKYRPAGVDVGTYSFIEMGFINKYIV